MQNKPPNKFASIKFTETKSPCEKCHEEFLWKELEDYRGKSYCAPCLVIVKDEERKKREDREKAVLPKTEPSANPVIPAPAVLTINVDDFIKLQQIVTGLTQTMTVLQEDVKSKETQIVTLKDQLISVKDQIVKQQSVIIENIKSPSDLETYYAQKYEIPSNLTYEGMKSHVNRDHAIPKEIGYFMIRMKKEFKAIDAYYEIIKKLANTASDAPSKPN